VCVRRLNPCLKAGRNLSAAVCLCGGGGGGGLEWDPRAARGAAAALSFIVNESISTATAVAGRSGAFE